jgi:hypothetical protein
MPACFNSEAEFEAYQTGWADCDAGRPNDENPFCRAMTESQKILRTRWYNGWYDCAYWKKYKDPLWARKVA